MLDFYKIRPVIIRLVLYGWLSLWIIMRSDVLLLIVYNYYNYVLVGLIAFSVILSTTKYDLKLLTNLKQKKYQYILYLSLSIIWVELGVEWISSTNPENYESLIYYEPIAIIMCAPASIFILLVKQFIHFENTKTESSIIWALYFSASIYQTYLFVRYMTKED